MPKKTDAEAPFLSAVDRAFVVLEKLSERRNFRLEDLSKATGLSKATVYRFLRTLDSLGYVRSDENGLWTLSLKLFNIGSKSLDYLDLIGVARHIAEDLRDSLGETVHMGVLDGTHAVYVLKIESRYTIRMHSRVGRRIPLYCTALGKTLLAWLPVPERDQTLGGLDFVPYTPHTTVSREALEAKLKRILTLGYSADEEEHEEGVRCLAAPLFDHTGEVTAALSVSWPVFRFKTEDEKTYIEKIQAAAREISRKLGWKSD